MYVNEKIPSRNFKDWQKKICQTSYLIGGITGYTHAAFYQE
jgi:hypothetical protein